ncbi:hypothetical protein QNO00_08060 [Arthrobacter sp. zg-Y1219]|nr:hypothetical protein [Arthrobacter sp. zg-Y1219]
MKKIAATVLLAAGIAAVGVAAPASAAPLNSDASQNVVSPLIYWPR